MKTKLTTLIVSLSAAGGIQAAETFSVNFCRESSVSPADQGYHWNQNGETYYLIGEAMGEGMLNLLTP